MGARGLVPWGGSPRKFLRHTVPGTTSRKRFGRLQFQRRPESDIYNIMATDPVVLAVPGTRKAGSGNERRRFCEQMSSLPEGFQSFGCKTKKNWFGGFWGLVVLGSFVGIPSLTKI